MIQSTEFKKVNEQKGPSEDSSISLRREKKAIIGGRGRERSGWERRQGGGKGETSGFGGGKE